MRLLLTVACVAALAWAQEKKSSVTMPSSSTEEVTVIGPAVVVSEVDKNMTTLMSNMTTIMPNMTYPMSNMTSPMSNMTSPANATMPMMPTTVTPPEEPSKTTEMTMEGNMTMPTLPENSTTHDHGNSSAVVVTSMSAVSLCLLSLLVVS